MALRSLLFEIRRYVQAITSIGVPEHWHSERACTYLGVGPTRFHHTDVVTGTTQDPFILYSTVKACISNGAEGDFS